MKKLYYDHKTVLCDGCAHFVPAGPRDKTSAGIWPDGCSRYGYSLTGPYPEPADECSGFQTPEQYAAELERREREKRNKSKIKTR